MERNTLGSVDISLPKLEAHPEKLSSLNAMESTGGEPDVVGYDKKRGEYIFYDCSAESPQGRRSICYDGEGQQEREKKGVHLAGNAIDIADAMGIELLNEKQYRELQKLGGFDTKTSSWIKTPSDISSLAGEPKLLNTAVRTQLPPSPFILVNIIHALALCQSPSAMNFQRASEISRF